MDYMWNYAKALEEAGYQVTAVNSADDALSLLETKDPRFDLTILDVMMPPGRRFRDKAHLKGMRTGIHLALRIAEIIPDLPIVILTNSRDPEIQNRLGDVRNVYHILWKDETTPFTLVQVLETLHARVKWAANEQRDPEKDNWQQLIHGVKQAVVGKFLSDPSKLTPSEFLLLSDLSHTIIRSVVRTTDKAAEKTSFSEETSEKLLSDVITQTDIQVRGRSLEELALRLFNTVPGFKAKSRLRTRTEEIDLFILNGSNDAPWRDMGPALIGECKNWSGKCGTEDFNHFESKVRNRRGQCKCGFFVSWNGFSRTFVQQRLRSSREDFLIVLIEGGHIEEAIAKGSFGAVLYRLWEEALRV